MNGEGKKKIFTLFSCMEVSAISSKIFKLMLIYILMKITKTTFSSKENERFSGVMLS